jgi:hypothetical protein
VVTTYRVRPYAIGWLGNDRLLLDHWGTVEELTVADGSTKESTHHGTLVSADGAFSVWENPEGAWEFWNDRTNTELGQRLRTLLGGRLPSTDPAPFWVEDHTTGHALCVTLCAFPKGTGTKSNAPGSCRVVVIDMLRMQILKEVQGRGIARTADRRGMLIYSNGGLRVEVLNRD